jgi:hypothetical protein
MVYCCAIDNGVRFHTALFGTPVARKLSAASPGVNGVTRSVRARRFPLRLPLVFRTRSDEPWRRATTLAISETQLSFASKRALQVGDDLEMRFVVRVSSTRSEVNCTGRVARVHRSAAKSDRPTYTATIGSYRFIKVR